MTCQRKKIKFKKRLSHLSFGSWCHWFVSPSLEKALTRRSPQQSSRTGSAMPRSLNAKIDKNKIAHLNFEILVGTHLLLPTGTKVWEAWLVEKPRSSKTVAQERWWPMT